MITLVIPQRQRISRNYPKNYFHVSSMYISGQNIYVRIGVHTVYIYSIPIHIVILANDTDTFPILIMISFSKFVIKKEKCLQNHILLPINNLKVGKCVIQNNFS